MTQLEYARQGRITEAMEDEVLDRRFERWIPRISLRLVPEDQPHKV